MDTAIVVVTTLVAVGATLYMFAMNNIQELKDNWPLYRCNPAYMPMAGLVGQDPFKTFTDCTMKRFQDYTGFVVDPIMGQFTQVNSIVTNIGGAMNDMRGMMAQTRTGFLGMIGTVFGKIHNLMSQFQYIIIRMRTLMARLVGIMVSFMNIFYTGQQTGPSIMNGPIGQTINFLCFDEDTLIGTKSGKVVYMKNLTLGDVLPNSNKVMSVYSIDGTNVPMYMLGNTKVSGGHKVWYQDEFIPVAEHPDAVRTSDSKNLVCINTHLRYFTIENHIFMDFTEVGPVFGLAGSVEIAPSLQISEVHIGDMVNGEIVRGTVIHAVNEKAVLYNLITDKSLVSGKVEKY
jgi:hypothetical protein